MSALKSLIAFLFIISTLFITQSSYAVVPTPGPLQAKDFNYFVYSQTATEGGIGHALLCMLSGISVLNNNICTGYKTGGQLWAFSGTPGGGAIGGLGSALASMYTNEPLSSGYYLANLGESIGLSQKPVYAQVSGSGETIIRPVFKLWQITRNIAYMAFILIFVAIGVMIMLRAKISSQTVISAQQALPSLVVGLILVTFSYFFAALMVDFVFVGMKLVAEIFMASNTTNFFEGTGVFKGPGQTGTLSELAEKANAFGLMTQVGFDFTKIGIIRDALNGQFSNVFGNGASLFSLGNFFSNGLTGILGAVTASIIAGLSLPGALTGGVGGVVTTQAVIPLLIIIVLLIALLIQAFRLVFALIGTYVQILVLTLAGPFYILYGSIPGKGNIIGNWWKGLLGNVMVFPAVFAAFLFAGVMLGDDSAWTSANTNLPLFAGLQNNLIRVLLAYGILLATPSLPDMVRGAFGVKSGAGGVGQAALAGFMAGAGVGGAVGRPLGQAAMGGVGTYVAGRPPGSIGNRAYRGLRRLGIIH